MKLLQFVFVNFLLIALIAEAQVTSPTRFPIQEYHQNNYESFLLGLTNNNLMMFWYDSIVSQIKSSKSNDGGGNWESENIVTSIISSEFDVDINAVVLNSGRILLTYRSSFYYITYSDNNGISWSPPVFLPTRPNPALRRKVYFSSIAKFTNGDVGFTYSISNSTNLNDAKGIFNIKSSDGITWSAADTIDLNGKNGQLIDFGNSQELAVYQDSTENEFDIFYRTSSDAGLNWSDQLLLVGESFSQSKPRIIKDLSGKTWVYYIQEEETPFDEIVQSNINFVFSLDDGNTWGTPEKFTKYVGPDENYNLSLWNGRPILSFISTRHFNLSNRFFQIYYTIADEMIDTNVPPFMYKFLQSSENPGPNQPYFIQAFVDDDREILSVKLNTFRDPPGVNEIIDMFDDGVHNDSLAGDKIYGAAITPQNYGDFISYYFLLEDDQMNLAEFSGGFVNVPLVFASDSYFFDVNNFKLPIDNRGVLAAVNINGQEGGWFDESVMLYAGGFFLSGLNNNAIWANAIAPASAVTDYQAGPLGSEPTDPFNKLYIVKSSDPPFGEAWQVYQSAVERGADFYDGNNDGIYNPVDLNSNNTWDANEDRPDFLGNVTAWCVYNDGVPSSYRRWIDQQPMGIEIQQTVFAWGENVSYPIDNMIFVRYRIFNKGTVASKFENVYYSSWADPDIGGIDGSQDDQVGCDTLLNLGYVYNNGPDVSYGSNPPALGIPFLQGPATYIPGETFIDNNGNQIYDDGIDTPLDSAYMNNGPVIGIKVLPGAKNQVLSSFIHYMNGDPILNDPNDRVEARNYMLGRTRTGESIDPCTWDYGLVFAGVNCATVDPRFLYSGNPVNLTGWINILEADQRILVNTGPFTLEENKPIDIVVCYLVGRGNNALNSITVMKNIAEEAIEIYNSNFTDIPTGIENQPEIVKEFKLSQNYPNPFNPSTKISWQSPVGSWQTLKIYDVLGNEVATLVNEYREAGSYDIEFKASQLSSGVYYYRLNAADFTSTKKMLMLK